MRRSIWFAAGASAAAMFSAAQAQEAQTYSYDVHGRLTAVTRSTGATSRTTTYTLDNADNRTQRNTAVTSSARPQSTDATQVLDPSSAHSPSSESAEDVITSPQNIAAPAASPSN